MFNASFPVPKAVTRKKGQGAKTRGEARRVAAKEAFERDSLTGQLSAGQGRFDAVMKAAERSGLLTEKSSRIAGRVSPTLVEQAKKRTGIAADTDLIAFALANVALEDDFPDAFKDARGKIDAGLKLGF
jgi:hypothetical protein